MALPIVIDVPTFDLKVPGTDKKYRFRPFLVKEEKILTIASQAEDVEEMVSACIQVVTNCSFGELDASTLAMHQLQWLFLQLRAKSVGDIFGFVLTCGNCQTQINYECKVDDFKIANETNTNKTKISIGENKGIVLKYPSLEVEARIQEMTDLDIIKSVIDSVYSGDEVYLGKDISNEDMQEFIESFPLEIKNQVIDFFVKKPFVANEVDFECIKCQHQNKIMINGYEHFFA